MFYTTAIVSEGLANGVKPAEIREAVRRTSAEMNKVGAKADVIGEKAIAGYSQLWGSPASEAPKPAAAAAQSATVKPAVAQKAQPTTSKGIIGRASPAGH